MASDVTEQGKYTVQPGAAFHVGDKTWVHFTVIGFEQPKTNGNYEVWVQWREFKLYNPDGTLLAALADVSEMHDTVDRIVPFVSFWIPLGEAESSDPLGEYRVEVTVEDKLAGDTASGSVTFVLE